MIMMEIKTLETNKQIKTKKNPQKHDTAMDE